MVSPDPEKCPLQVFVSAASEELLTPALRFIEGLTGVDAQVSVVSVDDIFAITDRSNRAPAELIVLIQDASHPDGSLDGLDAASMAMDSPVPVMVLPASRGESASSSLVRRILVPLDGSARAAQALPLATHIARGAGLPVQFVMVIDPSRVIPPAFAYDPESWTIVTALQETAHWALKQAEAPLMRAGIPVESSLLYGPVNACLQSAIEATDLVIMTTHGSGRSSGKIGSVALRVLATSSGPVILHRGHRQADVVVDGYEACSWVEPLSRRSEVSHLR